MIANFVLQGLSWALLRKFIFLLLTLFISLTHTSIPGSVRVTDSAQNWDMVSKVGTVWTKLIFGPFIDSPEGRVVVSYSELVTTRLNYNEN